MANSEKELHFEPYARLLTMLGDQLIKDEKTALVELIRNSYDADASHVDVRFENFGENWETSDQSKIIIQDDGCGMTREIIESAWMNPASPNKRKQKRIQMKTPIKHRTMQGEKGIGRFAIFKLGACVHVTTRAQGAATELNLVMDFSSYKEEFTLMANGQECLPFLRDLTASLTETQPKVFIGSGVASHGTRLEISALKIPRWTDAIYETIATDVSYLQPIFSLATGHGTGEKDDFEVIFERNGSPLKPNDDKVKKLRELMEEKAVLRVEGGSYDAASHVFTFRLNGENKIRRFDELRHYSRDRFAKRRDNESRYPECGSFRFTFYAFDLRVDKEDVKTSRFALRPEEVDIVKKHRIYLYRDGIRVFPYGDSDDDWLQIDMLRGTSAASAYLSNDQLVGCVEITQKDNPDLRDKTSREGLVSEGPAVRDFVDALQMFLQYLRKEPFAQYRQEVKNRREYRARQREKLAPAVDKLAKYAETLGNQKLTDVVRAVSVAAKTQKEISEKRTEILEDLAGVGLSVEAASHDLMMMASRATTLLQNMQLELEFKSGACAACRERIMSIADSITFIEQRVRDLQPLFRSSRQKVHEISLREVLDKVLKVYAPVLKTSEVAVPDITGDDFSVSCTDAVLMQTFINLLDNSLYWLTKGEVVGEPKISITIDSRAKEFIFSDNGPGISSENAPYIFDPFFSTKKSGRGLGLYIAKQLLGRYGYSIALMLDAKRPGATFVISFERQEVSDEQA